MNSTEKLITAFVLLIVGVALIGVVAQQIRIGTETSDISNESFSLATFRADFSDNINTSAIVNLTNAYGDDDWQWNECSISVTSMAFANGTALATTTDYNATANGAIALYNSSSFYDSANTTNVIYSYCADDYMNLGWGRSVMQIVPGFFAIAMLLIALAMFYGIAKESGLM